MLQEDLEEKPQVMLRCTTRWLSLGKVLGRILEQWDVLCEYFKNKTENKIGEQIHDLLVDENYVFLTFLYEVISYFDSFNSFFQSESIQID